MRLYFLPFSGANKFSYGALQKRLPQSIETTALELPGHGARIREPLLRDLDSMSDDIMRLITPTLPDRFALYGHSMGAELAHRLALRLRDAGLPQPAHIFCSGRSGPSATLKKRKIYLLPRDEFIAELRDMGGSPDEVLEHQEIMAMYEPILRADFEAGETRRYVSCPPLTTPFTVMIGSTEDISESEARLWQRESTEPIELLTFSGGHFFIFEHIDEISKIFAKTLEAAV